MAGVARILRGLALAALCALGSFFAYWGAYVFAKTWGDYKDNSDATYMVLGGLLVSIGALFFLSALALVWRRASLPAALGLLMAGLLPYAALFGSPAVVLNAGLIGLGLALLIMHFWWVLRGDGQART